jgi:hypothetical protein
MRDLHYNNITVYISEPFDSLLYYAKQTNNKKIVKALEKANKEWRKKGKNK